MTENTPTPVPNQPVVKPVIGKNILSVLSTFAAIILVLIFGSAFILAKTGFVNVPLFSRWYVGPKPIRIVEAEPIDATAFRVLVSSRILAQAAANKKPPYKISLSEAELTGGVQSVINQALRDQDWQIENPQLAITPESVEFFGRLRRNATRVEVLFKFEPVVQNGGLKFEPSYLRVGDYPIHPKLINDLASLFFSRDLGTWVFSSGDIRLESVILKDGKLDLTVSQRAP